MAIAPIMKKKYPITQKFGNKLILNGKDFYGQRGYAGHMGVDFGTPIGTELLAGLEGQVTVKDEGKVGYGLSVRISKQRKDGSSGIIYAHLSETPLKTGMMIKVGDVIGKSGNTGASTGPHLHFGLRLRDVNGKIINENNGFKGRINALDYFVDGKYRK